jgi:ABC-type transporter Mla maintaining outer membrane lipid asymmetry permease subunit MlaE
LLASSSSVLPGGLHFISIQI